VIPKKIKQLAAALMAYDPLLGRQALAQDEIDLGSVRAVAGKIKEAQPGIKWALTGVQDGRVVAYVYDDLLEAAEDYDPDAQGEDYLFLAACKVQKGAISLSMDGKWMEVEVGQ
jgi:hypothetical protein